MIRDEQDFEKHVDHTHFNPVKHFLARTPGEWPYLSFHRYIRDGLYDVHWGAGEGITFDEAIGHE